MVRVAQEMQYKSPNLRKLMSYIKDTVEKPHLLMASSYLLQHSGDLIKGFPTLRAVLAYLQDDIMVNGLQTFHVERLFDVKRDVELAVVVQKSFGKDFLEFKVRIQTRSDRPSAAGMRRLTHG